MNIFEHIKKFINKNLTKSVNDGYVLVYALIVITILTAMILGAFTIALNNMKSQQNFAADMQKRYEAEGYVEILVATLGEKVEAATVESGTATAGDMTIAEANAKSDAKAAAKDAIVSNISEMFEHEPEYVSHGIKAGPIAFDETHNTLTIPVEVTTSDAKIETKLVYTVSFSTATAPDSWEAIPVMDPDNITVIVGYQYQYDYSAYAELKNLIYGDYAVTLN